MPKKYHITPKPTPLGLDYIFKFSITRSESCINCGKCTRVCIYEAHKRRDDDPRKMAAPDTTVCRNCFRCIQECPRGALEMSGNDDFMATGGEYWTPEMQLSLFKQAETGKVPVSGSGYRGPFSGSGFDSMWTDMSEIVRPTRDGINGREYINTGVDVGRKLSHLDFSPDGCLSSSLFNNVSLPLPVMFDVPAIPLPDSLKQVLVQAAAEIGSYIILPAGEITPDMAQYGSIIPLVESAGIEKYESILKDAQMVSVAYNSAADALARIKDDINRLSRAVVIVRMPATQGIEETVAGLARGGAAAVHIVADYRSREVDNPAGAQPRFLKDVIRAVHKRLVEDGIRDEITLVASGGIAMAEHVAKAMLCGADLTAIDIPLLIALGAKIYEEPQKKLVLPEGLDKIAPQILRQRVINLMASWHSQILEVMGAMGIREASRLRGEAGRAIFFEEIERDTFGNLFGTRSGK
jgi:ferredoxin